MSDDVTFTHTDATDYALRVASLVAAGFKTHEQTRQSEEPDIHHNLTYLSEPYKGLIGNGETHLPVNESNPRTITVVNTSALDPHDDTWGGFISKEHVEEEKRAFNKKIESAGKIFDRLKGAFDQVRQQGVQMRNLRFHSDSRPPSAYIDVIPTDGRLRSDFQDEAILMQVLNQAGIPHEGALARDTSTNTTGRLHGINLKLTPALASPVLASQVQQITGRREDIPAGEAKR